MSLPKQVVLVCPQCLHHTEFEVHANMEPLLHHHYVCDGCESVLKIERVGLQLKPCVVQSGKSCATGNCGE